MTDEQPQPGGRRADRAAAPGTGRRAEEPRRRTLDVVVALAIGLPAIVAVGTAVIRHDTLPEVAPTPPTQARLTSASVVCPGAAVPGDVQLTRVPGVDGGRTAVRVAGRDGKLAPGRGVDVVPDRLATVREDTAPVEISGEDAAAPGLVAGRGGATAPAECRAPGFDEWFVGLGAASENSSTVELANPDDGAAIVEIALYGPHGPIKAEELRGIIVKPHSAQTIDLSTAIPRRVDLAAHVTVTQGRVVTTVRHTVDPLGNGRATTDYPLAQAAPQTESLMLGVPGTGSRRLFVMNPGDEELRAKVQVVTARSVFTPAGVRDIVVAPEDQGWVNLGTYLPAGAMKDALGLLVTTSQPAVTGVRTLVAGDVAEFGGLPRVEKPTVAVLPEGAKRLVLGGGERTGIVHVTATDAAGKVLLKKDVEIGAGRASQLELPAAAVAIRVESRATPVSGVVLVSGPPSDPGLGVVRLRDAEVYAEVPAVSPE